MKISEEKLKELKEESRKLREEFVQRLKNERIKSHPTMMYDQVQDLTAEVRGLKKFVHEINLRLVAIEEANQERREK